MAGTGVGFASLERFWPLAIVAFVGTLNPSAGDVSLFLPPEQSLLTHMVGPRGRTALFARYSLIGTLAGALGTGPPILIARTLAYPSATCWRRSFSLCGPRWRGALVLSPADGRFEAQRRAADGAAG